MKRLITLLPAFFSITAFSQIYTAQYKVYSSIGDEKTPVPTTLDITYFVKCDERYIEVIGKLNGMSVDYSSEIGSNAHVIIDTKKKLAYYVYEKKMKRLEEYKLSGQRVINKLDYEQHVVNKPNAIITTSKSIPKNIIPGVLFKELEYGVKKISSPKLSIMLDGKIKKTNGSLINYASLFNGYEDKNLDTVHFFN